MHPQIVPIADRNVFFLRKAQAKARLFRMSSEDYAPMNAGQKRSVRGWTTLAFTALVLVACADPASMTGTPSAEGPVAPISDPVVAFAAAASPGAEDSIVLPGTGQSAQVRLVRAYAAASGRECREVQVRTGGGADTRLICRAGTGWREARPLVRDAALRP